MNNTLNLTKMSYSNLWTMKNFLIGYIILFGTMSIINPFMLSLLIPIIVYTATYQVMEFEDKNNIGGLIESIPVTRSEYIKSRYALVVGNLFLGIIIFSICFILMELSRKYFDITEIHYSMHSYKMLFITGTMSACITMSFLIPSLIKFGSVIVRYIAFIVFALFVMVPVLVLPSMELTSKIFAISENMLLAICLVSEIIILTISYTISSKLYINKKSY